MQKTSQIWAILGALALSACGPSAFVRARMGAPHASRPADCKVHFAYRGLEEMPPHAEKLGIVGVGLADNGWTDGMKAAVQPLVCELGGDLALISMVGVNAWSGAKSTNVEVYRAGSAKKTKNHAKLPPTTTVSL